jgi:FtsP/CotA-like multicopper oxidase with cupredoxin domain
MRATNMKKINLKTQLLLAAMVAVAMLFTVSAQAAAPGITGTTFALTAAANYLNQPDGQAVYSWGYGCTTAPPAASFAPAGLTKTGFCNTMQVPGPTLIVTEGQTVQVTLTNGLPAAAGNTSILFPGFQVSTTGGVTGLLTQEAAPGSTVVYSFVASSPGTRSYYSGTQSDLQVEMGLYGAIIVLPAASKVPANCTAGALAGSTHIGFSGANGTAENFWHENDFRLAPAAYDHPDTCYDREYLFQFAEMDPNIHTQALAQVTAKTGCTAGAAGCSLNVPTEPYHPAYFLINGRSMPDDMDPNYASEYPHQPYNGDPHMHPGELTLIRVIGQGRWQHPFHEHGNHVRILARDGNLIVSSSTLTYAGTTTPVQALAGPLQFTTTTTPGLAFDGIFYWTAKGLNWDAYGHNPTSKNPSATLPCTPDGNGYNTGAPTAINYYEWCQDHNKPVQAAPFGDVNGGGPATLPDPNLFTNGPWYGGSPYLGPDATTRATGCTAPGKQANGPNGTQAGAQCGQTGSTPPSGTIANSPSSEAGFAFMWHSHNEREITTNNIFPGGMLMMMLVDSREYQIDETN